VINHGERAWRWGAEWRRPIAESERTTGQTCARFRGPPRIACARSGRLPSAHRHPNGRRPRGPGRPGQKVAGSERLVGAEILLDFSGFVGKAPELSVAIRLPVLPQAAAGPVGETFPSKVVPGIAARHAQARNDQPDAETSGNASHSLSMGGVS